MAGLQDLYQTDLEDEPGLWTNFKVDYVLHYKIPPLERAESEASFIQLIESLTRVGFATEVRPGTESSLLVFVRIASDKLLAHHIYHSRVQDWLYGVRTAAPGQELIKYVEDEPASEAERLRLAYLLITQPSDEGGAGVTVGMGQWRFVASVFPLHDHIFNRAWISKWSKKYSLEEEDLNTIRQRFGEQTAFYFAFLQSYSSFLLFPATFGLSAWLLLGRFSVFYAVVNCLWSVFFFEHWKCKEVDLAIQWGVRGVSKIQQPRSQFRFEREAIDPVTGKVIKIFSPYKRLWRQFLQVPFVLACVIMLGGLIAGCFAIEIFITELYNGPFKQYLTILPTVLLTIFNPTLTTLLTKLAKTLTHIENYETHDTHEAAFVQKIFVINFITSYVPIFLTAFVYVPFGKILIPYLDVFRLTAAKFTSDGKPVPTKEWAINPDRLTKQIIYFTGTAQVINLITETMIPYVKRRMFKAYRSVKTEIFQKGFQQPKDTPEEAAFLQRVRNEAELDVYDVTVDYREMVVQFGYLSLFSVIWPLTACPFLVNNWIEARSDAVKIAFSSQRPIPRRSDSIGPWLDCLGFLSWLGSLTSAALVYLFHGTGGLEGSLQGITGWALLLSIFLAEHLYLLVQFLVRGILSKVERPGLQQEWARRFATRKRLLEQTLGSDATVNENSTSSPKIRAEHTYTKEALEDSARMAAGMGPEERFVFLTFLVSLLAWNTED